MQNFQNLRVWHAAQELSLRVIGSLPERRARRVPGLRSQAIRAARSIPSNIAEGCGRPTRADFLHFLDIAMASLNELEGHLITARDTQIFADSVFSKHKELIVAVGQMLSSLRSAVEHAIAVEQNARKPDPKPPATP